MTSLKDLPVHLRPAREEGMVTFLCSKPDSRDRNKFCSGVLAIVAIDQVERFTRTILICHQCREETIFA